METITLKKDLISLTHELGKDFAKRSAETDLNGEFVFENYLQLKEHKYFSAMIPEALGGSGLSHSEVCEIIRIISLYCGSTALAFSMHQHLIAATIWKYNHKGEGEVLLRNVAENQLVLVSTGARDWLDSNGEMEKTNGGYYFSARKHFASQSIGGDIAVTSAPFEDEAGSQWVLHFGVPFKADGVSVLDDWDTMGMRGTGSQTIVFDKVFIPDSAISLKRPRTGYHGVWDIVITVAMPLIMSAYLGLAEKGMEIALSIGKKYQRNQKHLPYILGKMNNSLVSTKTQLNAMVALANDLNFKPSDDITNQMLALKTNVTTSAIDTVSQAMEAIGGQSFYRKNVLERIFRDVNAAPFHPLPKWEQYAFIGERLLK